MKAIFDLLSKFKSPWYYWHAGYKYQSLLILVACAAASWLLLGLSAGFDILLILILIVLDAVGLILLLVYLLLLRPYIPPILGDYVDNMAIWHFVLAAMSVVINRCVTYFIARKVFRLPSVNGFITSTEPGKSLKDTP